MSKTFLVFAFGSNMSLRQALTRCPGAELVGPALLRNHRLVFAGHSNGWGGAVASIEKLAGSRTPGLLFRVTKTDLERLDRYEGAPFVYERIAIKVTGPRGTSRNAYAYQLRLGKYGPPSSRYLGVIWKAYREWGFDAAGLAEAVALGCEGKAGEGKAPFVRARDLALRVMQAAQSAQGAA